MNDAGVLSRPVSSAGLRRSTKPKRKTERVRELLQEAVDAHRRGEREAAARLYRRVLDREPDQAIAMNDLGVLLIERGEVAAGEELVRKAVAAKPDYAAAWFNLGALLFSRSELDEALTALEQAVAVQADYADAHFNLGMALEKKERSDDALAAFDRAIAIRPQYPEAYFGRGNVLKAKGSVDEAILAYREAVAQKPDYAEAYAKLGLACASRDDLDEAVTAYRRSHEIQPNNPEVLSNLGIALIHKGEVNAAIAVYRKALALAADWPHAHFGLSLALLQSGEYGEGWREYEWRWKGALKEIKPREIPKPQWQGEDLSGKKLLLHAEQGLGDTLQFVRFIPGLQARGAKVILHAPRKLLSLLRMAHSADFLASGEDSVPAFDYHLPLLSLPSVIGTNENNIPREVPYLAADPIRVARWRDRLPQDGLRIGVAWQGNATADIDKGRSIPLRCFAPLAAVPGVRLISLQKNDGLDQLDALPPGMRVESLGDEFDAGPDAFLDTAAAMTNLDLVVTSDTSIAHLAGALGRPVWIVLKYSPDWRWLLDREDSPWYPTARLFRQTTAGDWDEVLQRVAMELAAVAEGAAERLLPPASRSETAPLDVGAVFDRGFVLHREGRLDEAAALYRKAVTINPNHAEAHANLGVILQGNGHIDEAIALYRRAIEIKPTHVPALGNLAVALTAKGDFDGAVAACKDAVAAKPDDADGYVKFGDAVRKKGDIDGAIAAYEQAVALAPEDAKAHFALAYGWQTKGARERAIEEYRQALALDPSLAQAHANLGVALVEGGQIEEGLAACRRSIELKPDAASYHLNLGNALKEAGTLEEAIAEYSRAAEIDPGNAGALANLALALSDSGMIDAAIETGRKAIAIRPDYAEAHFNLSLLLLQKGLYTEGWHEYEWRWKGGVKELQRRPFRGPQWQGEDLHGKTLVLHAEQGFGDTLQFARFAPALMASGAQIVMAVPRELVALLRTIPDGPTIVAGEEQLPSYDFHLPLMSVPAVLRTTEQTIPAKVPYFAADPERVALWRRRLPAVGFKIGIVWQGRPDAKIDKGRSVPLRAFAPLAAVPGVHLISLQKNHGLDQLADPPEGLQIHALGSDFDDGPDAFLDTAAVMESLDLVITSDTSAAHLAGALGRPVWVVLKHIPDWRWMLDREYSPWYPSMRLFRQRHRGDWDDVFARVAAELHEVVSGQPGRLLRAADVVLNVPVSVGELVDKITILQIKSERISDPVKLENVRSELDLLRQVWVRTGVPGFGFDTLMDDLKKINETLWIIEDEIRDCELRGDFGPKFIELARAVYRTNDSRAAIKREINLLAGSAIIEEKSYRDYRSAPSEDDLHDFVQARSGAGASE